MNPSTARLRPRHRRLCEQDSLRETGFPNLLCDQSFDKISVMLLCTTSPPRRADSSSQSLPGDNIEQMQSTTRSVDALEEVVKAKAMASGEAMSHAAANGSGKSACVEESRGRRKRKGLSGGLPTCITNGKKKLCNSSTNEMIKPPVEGAVKGSSWPTMKRNERIDDEDQVDPVLFDAATALTDLLSLREDRPSDSSPSKSLELSGNQSRDPSSHLRWGAKKIRSAKIKRVENPSIEGGQAITTVDNPPDLVQPPLQQQVSECSSSPTGDSPSVVTLVKVEVDPFWSSTEAEDNEQDQVQEGRDQEENNSCPSSDLEMLHKPVSDSNSEFPQPDSRADSSSSPPSFLPGMAEDSTLSVVPKLEGNLAGRSAFQRVVVPIRPVKKPTVCRKLKVEEITFEAVNPEQAEVKHVSRKKPRPTGCGQQKQQQLGQVKIEEEDACCTLALGPRLSSAEGEKVKQQETRIIDPDAVVEVEEITVKLDPVFVKLESKLSGKLGQRTGGKPKPALSETEKEARKQRRVQANRESARQTIRRKQVLCEELSIKSQHLSTENETLRKELELVHQKHKNLSEINGHLTEEVAKSAANWEPRSASPAPLSMDNAPSGLLNYQFPVPQFGGLPFSPYIWAMAVAQVAQAAGMQPSEINMNSTDVLAAAAAFGTNFQAGTWNMLGGSQGQLSLRPPFIPHQPVFSSVVNTLPSSSLDMQTNFSPLTRSISLPVAPGDASFSMVASERGLTSGKSLVSVRSGDFADSAHLSHDMKRTAAKCDTAHQGSAFNGRADYFNITSGSQSGMSTATGVGSIPMRKSGDGNILHMLTGPGQLLGRSHSLAAPQAPKIVHSRYPMFGSGGMLMTQERSTMRETEAQRAAAAATEARRRRRELTRTKSMQQRQTARLAEPSAS